MCMCVSDASMHVCGSNAHTFKLNRSLIISPFRAYICSGVCAWAACNQSILHSKACNQGFLALMILVLVAFVSFREEQAVELHLNDLVDLNDFFSNLPFI